MAGEAQRVRNVYGPASDRADGWRAELLDPAAGSTWDELGAYLRDPARWSPAVARVLA